MFELFENGSQLIGLFPDGIKILTDIRFLFAEFDFYVFEFFDVDSLELLKLLPKMSLNKLFVHFAGLDLDFGRIQVPLYILSEPVVVEPNIPQAIFKWKHFMSLVPVLSVNAMHAQDPIFIQTIQA